MTRALAFLALLLQAPALASADTYEVGPGLQHASIGDVPWEALRAGDTVLIHWRPDPYQEKFVLCAQGTADAPITVRGVPGPEGALPVISGEDATTRAQLDYTNEARGVVKIGSANRPPDVTPTHIVIERLAIRSGHPSRRFTSSDGSTEAYAEDAAALYVEKAQHLTIRNCELSDSGNGLFIGVFDGETQDVLVEGNDIHDNGVEGSIYEHNSYTAAIGITFQYNHYGPLRPGAEGNNLKDRSAGLVVRYNWIESGNRQLDLVDGEDSAAVPASPAYRQTFVYGNVLVEPDGAGNSQIVHYGGDSTKDDGSPNSDIYRKGTLHFYNNTVVSTRSGNTTLLRLSTNDEQADCRNNIVHVTADGSALALLAGAGQLRLSHNWLPAGWVDTHDSLVGTIDDDGTNLTGGEPGFVELAAADFRLAPESRAVNAGGPLSDAVLPDHDVTRQYVAPSRGEARPLDPPLDLGAFERCTAASCPDSGDSGGSGGAGSGGGSGAGGATDSPTADASARPGGCSSAPGVDAVVALLSVALACRRSHRRR